MTDRLSTPRGTLLRERFLTGMSNAACTVSVVTTDGRAGRFGSTISAMSSVSADTPQPTLLICVSHHSGLAKAIVANGAFCVNILRDDQSHLSDCFAGRWRTADGDRFSCGDWFSDVTGSPRAVDSLVAFSCRLASWQQIGTHCVFFGSVEDVALSNRGSPLIYVNKAYGTALRLEPRSQDPAAPV